MQFLTGIFVLSAVVLGVVLAGPDEDFNTTIQELAAQVRPFLKKIPDMIEKCVPLPADDLKVVQDCLTAIPTEIPCLVDNFLQKKPIDTCFEDLIKDFNKMVKAVDFVEAVIKNLNGENLDVDKATEKIAKYSFASKYKLTTEEIKKTINSFLERNPDYIKDQPIDFFGMRNITVGCPKTKTAFIAAVYSVEDEVGTCLSEEVEKLIKEMANSS